MIFIKLPMPISVNRMYKRTKRGIYLNPEAAKYKSDVKLMTKSFRKVFKDEKKRINLFHTLGT